MKSYSVFNQIINLFKNIETSEMENKAEEIEKGDIKIVPKIFYDEIGKNLKIEIRIGNDVLYKVKSLPDFYRRYLNNESFKYGPKLEFVHNKEAFCKESQSILEYILKYSEIIIYANETTNGYEYYTKRLGEDSILISNSGIDELFDVMKGQEIEMETRGKSSLIEFSEEDPQINFFLKSNKQDFELTTNVKDYTVFCGRNFDYILINAYLLH